MGKQSADGHLLVKRMRAGQKVAVIENVTIWAESTWKAYADHGDDTHIVTGKEKYVAGNINLNDYYLWQGKAIDTNNYYSVYALIWKIETTTDNNKKLYLRTKYFTVSSKGDKGDDALQYIIECDNETPNITNGAVNVNLTAYTQLGKQQRQKATIKAGDLWWQTNQTSWLANPLTLSVNKETTVMLRTSSGVVATKHITPVKDGQPGAQGLDGCIQRVTEWASGIEFHNDEELTSGTRFLDIAVITESATSFKAYKCLKTHVSSSSNAPQAGVTTEYWEPFNSMAPIYTPMIMAQYALLRLAQTNQLLVMKADGKTVNAAMGGGTYPLWVGATEGANAPFRVDENGKLYATGAEISGTVNATDGTFKGKLNGVSGTFYKLSALDANGKEACTIYFSSDGHLTFEGDLYNQGYNTAQGRSYRFYTSDVWCRGQFGASERNVLVVNGTYGYYYTKGMAYRGTYVSFTKETSSNNITYYVLPMNGTSGDYAGFPVDVVVFNINSSTVYNYELLMYNSQRVLVVNANDEQDNVKIFSNGDLVTWLGGEMAEVIKLANVMRPTPDSSLIGCGLMVGAFRDNNW